MDRIEVKFASEDVDAKTGEFSGYGAVFGNIDSHGDVIEKGAFKASLREWRKKSALPSMLIQHGYGLSEMSGVPVGVWSEMEEDDQGLKVKGRLINLDTDRGRTIHGAMKEGALRGLSIGYRAVKFRYGQKPAEPYRTLSEVALFEVSVVAEPSNEKARVAAMKSALLDLTPEDIRDLDAAFRTEELSQRDAKKAVSAFKKWLQRDAGAPGSDPRDEDAAAKELAEAIRRNITTLSLRG